MILLVLPLQDKLPKDIACFFPYRINFLRILLLLPLQDKLPKDIACPSFTG
jgi:hypothetical protein